MNPSMTSHDLSQRFADTRKRIASAALQWGRTPDSVQLVAISKGHGADALRTLAGLVTVSEGEATVLGVDLRTDRKAARHRVGLLGHATGLYDELTVADNVRFWARAARAHDTDVEAALVRLGLDGRLRRVAVGRLSTGQRRRASLACLVARRPELWLLDEPLTALDDEGCELVRTLLDAHRGRGGGAVCATHPVLGLTGVRRTVLGLH